MKPKPHRKITISESYLYDFKVAVTSKTLARLAKERAKEYGSVEIDDSLTFHVDVNPCYDKEEVKAYIKALNEFSPKIVKSAQRTDEFAKWRQWWQRLSVALLDLLAGKVNNDKEAEG